MKRRKALAGAALVAALVFTPMALMGAYAEEGDPAGAPSVALLLDPTPTPSETPTPTPTPSETPTPEPEKKVFVCKYVGTPGVDEHLQGGGNPTNPSINSIKGFFEEGHVIEVGDTFTDGHGRSVVIALDNGQADPTIDDCPGADPGEATASVEVTPPTCDDLDGHLSLIYEHATVTAVERNGGAVDIEGFPSGEYFAPTPGAYMITLTADEGFAFGVDQDAMLLLEFIVPTGLNDVCDEVAIPTQFDAEPTPPTCDTDGALPDISGQFPNVTLSFDRPFDGPGTYTLTVTANEGFIFGGGNTEFSRTITVDGALGSQSEDPEAPCFLLVVPQPAAPTFADACGTANDVVTIPEDTEAYFYEYAEEGDTVFIEVFLVSDEDSFPEGTVTEWEFTFTDSACPGPPPTTTALPATGGPDMMPWGIGAASMLLAGAALLTARRLARR